MKNTVWSCHRLMEKGMEENLPLCPLCSRHGHWNKGILKEYWYCDLHVKMKVAQSCLFATPWTMQFMEFSRPEYWSGLPFPSPGDLPNPRIEPRYPELLEDSLPAEPPGNKPQMSILILRHHQLNFYNETHRYNTYTFSSPLYFLQNGTTIFIQFMGIIFH